MSLSLAEKKKKSALTVLVIQLGTEAELYRSLMAMKAIKHLYPDCKLHLLVRRELKTAPERVEWISKVISTPEVVEASAFRSAALWVDQVVDENYDILVNWTFTERYSRLGAIAASLIPSVVKLGDFVREDLSIASFDAWSMYRQAWVREQIDQDIHSTDIITTQLLTALQIHAGDPHPDAGATAVTSRYFFKSITASIPLFWATRPKNLKWIAVQLKGIGVAQDESKAWIESILKRHPDTGILVLHPLDSPVHLAPELKSRLILVEQDLSTDEAIHLFSQIQWLISGESHWVDLASLMNVRVLFTPKKAWAVDGPYGNGHLIIEKANAESIYAIWSYFHSEWFHKGTFSLNKHFENLGCQQSLNEVIAYRSRIRAAQEGGGVTYEKVAPDHQFDFDSWMTRVRGQIARAWFCGWLPSIESEVSQMKLSPALVKRVRELQESLVVLSKLTREGKLTALQLFADTEHLPSGNIMGVESRDLVEAAGKKIAEIEGLISRVVSVDPSLDCILKFYQILMHNLKGETISAMAKESAQAFELMDEGVEMISVYAQKTLEFAKPKSVAAEMKVQDLRT